MAARGILRDFTVFFDGRGFIGDAPEVNPPDLDLVVDDHRAGGMDGPVGVAMGQNAITTSFVLTNYSADAMRTWGFGEGIGIPLTLRGHTEGIDGITRRVLIQTRGLVRTIARGNWRAGEKASLTITHQAQTYRETHDGEVIYEIDLLRMVRIVGGVDQLAERRRNLGV